MSKYPNSTTIAVWLEIRNLDYRDTADPAGDVNVLDLAAKGLSRKVTL